jgi:hypothetical protein
MFFQNVTHAASTRYMMVIVFVLLPSPCEASCGCYYGGRAGVRGILRTLTSPIVVNVIKISLLQLQYLQQLQLFQHFIAAIAAAIFLTAAAATNQVATFAFVLNGKLLTDN